MSNVTVKQSMKTYRRLLQTSKNYWAIFLLGVIGTIGLSLVDAALTWMVKPLFNKGFIARDPLFLKSLPLAIILVFVARGISGFASNYFISRVARNVVMDFRRQIFAKLLEIPAKFYNSNTSGHLLSTIIYNVEQVAQASSDALLTCLQEGSLLIGLVVVMFVVCWQLSLFFLIVCPFIAWVIKWSSSRLRRLSSTVQQSVGDVTHVADESIQGYQVIRLYGGQRYEYDKFSVATKRNQQRELKVVITNSIGTAIVQSLIAVPIAATLILAVMPSLHITAGSFGSVITSMVMILRPLRRLTTVNTTIQKGVAGADSIFEILDEEVEKDDGEYIAPRPVTGHIEFNQVNFSYINSKAPVLQDINFKIKPGHTVAFVGRSGAGKSTLINLLPRFYEVQSGEIKIDGRNINEYRLANLREQFALVSQHPVLFNDTIANNIAYGIRSQVTQEQIIAAAEAACALEFIEHLPEGLNTLIGEDGMLLSGGQRQRIAIARALLRNAPILILDEATSALDTHSERHIQKGLENLMQKRTTLVIAHRLSTIENADWIVVLDHGKIVEQGTHRELLERNDVYAVLHQMQFKEPVNNLVPA